LSCAPATPARRANVAAERFRKEPMLKAYRTSNARNPVPVAEVESCRILAWSNSPRLCPNYSTFIHLWDYKFQRVEESVLNGTSSFQFNAVSIFRRDELREVP